MSVKVKFTKQFTDVSVPGGGTILVRATGKEFERKIERRIADLKAVKGLSDKSLSSLDILEKSDKLTPTQLIDMIIESHDSLFGEDSRGVLTTLSHSVLLGLAIKFSCCTIDEYTQIALEESIGETFGGFRDFVDEDEKPIPDHNSDGSYNKENCIAVLSVDEVWAKYIETRNRLTAQRTQRWTDAAKNLPLPASGGPSGAVN
jgi:hypothetical protein